MSDILLNSEKLQQAVNDAVIAHLRKGEWISVDYRTRIPMDVSFLRGIFDRLDMAEVVTRVRDRVTDHVADKIFNAMATEVANDVKQILSNQELREDIRGLIRSRIREVQSTLMTTP